MRLPPLATLAPLALCAPTSAQVDYPPTVETYFAPSGLRDFQLGDLNGDGLPELVTSEDEGGRIEVRLNLGDGTFGSAMSVAVLSGPSRLALGHLDADGILDLAVLRPAAKRVVLFAGDGAGGFTQTGAVSVLGTLSYVELADLDGDGLDDLLVAETSQPVVVAALNAGAASFPTLVPIPVIEGPANVAVGDVDGNGFPDIVASNESITVTYGGTVVLLGADLSVVGTHEIPNYVGGEVGWVELADLDEDGVLDLVVNDLEFGGWEVIARRGAGDGTFNQVLWYELSSDFTQVFSLGDGNGDGHADLMSFLKAGSAQRYAGTGTGKFLGGATTPIPTVWFNTVPRLLTADLDGDGDDDTVVADGLENTLWVLRSEPEELSVYNPVLKTFVFDHSLALQLGAPLAGAPYLVVGSASGTSPGLVVDGLAVDLVVDAYTLFTVGSPGVWIQGGVGLLGAAGEASATITALPGLQAQVANLQLHHLFLVLDPGTGQLQYVSAPQSVLIQ